MGMQETLEELLQELDLLEDHVGFAAFNAEQHTRVEEYLLEAYGAMNKAINNVDSAFRMIRDGNGEA